MPALTRSKLTKTGNPSSKTIAKAMKGKKGNKKIRPTTDPTISKNLFKTIIH